MKSSRLCAALILLLVCAAPLAAQTAVGDSAWTAGSFDVARKAYETALAADPNAVRPLYRLAIMASWHDQLDSARALIGRARAIDPQDVDLILEEAQILAWQGKLRAALARYDSVTTAHPDRRDAALERARTLAWANRFDAADSSYAAWLARDPDDLAAQTGRAQVWAWRGDFKRAERGYRAVLREDPWNVDALVGLAQLHYWQGRVGVAQREAARALSLDSTSVNARQLTQTIRTGLRPAVEFRVDYTRDSDHNTGWAESASAEMGVAPGVRATVSGGLQQSHSPNPLNGGTISADRSSGDVGLIVQLGSLRLTGGAGARRVSPDGAAAKTVATYRGGVGVLLAPRVALTADYSHSAFDETADLISRELEVDAVEGGFDATLPGGTEFTLGGGRAWIDGALPDDDNVRTSGIVAVTTPIHGHFFVGAFGRMLGYRDNGGGFGYFAPDRFTVAELRAGYQLANPKWEAGLSGGGGLQWISRSSTSQGEWHVEGRLGR
ncbi:MAG TPA: tetratricopeptide repeat protein, partial [Gemmatimonadales bacterium]|nr:tetratricopeptide repeat protein [Gemmatimonadales bacterium]